MYEFIVDLMFKIPIIIPVMTIVLPLILGSIITPKHASVVVSILVFTNIIIFSFSSHPTIGMSGFGLYLFSFWIIIFSICAFIKHKFNKKKSTHFNQ